jgi:hypothetical protein
MRAGEGWTARCPAHEDTRNSLSIGRGHDGRWLLKCHAGCALEAILHAAGLTKGDLFPTRQSRIAARYEYRDEENRLLYEVIRLDHPKDFRTRAADGAWTIKGLRRVLYRLPQLQGRPTVHIVEGEKDADRLWSLEVPATTNLGGAGKWRPEYLDMLRGAGCHEVVIFPDNDPPGRAHGMQIARSAVDAGLSVKLIPLPDLPEKGDVSNYLDRHSRADLAAIVREAPLFRPSQPVSTSPALTFTNIGEFLGESDSATDWLVEGLIARGSVNLLAAPPKVGKSTFVRALGYCVARGRPFLERHTMAGPVWFLIFQDKRSEVRHHLRRLGATPDLPIRLFIGPPSATLIAELHDLAVRDRPVLIVVDMLAHVLRGVSDFNDYGSITRAFDPLLLLSRTTGAALVLVHHGSAHAHREGLDAVLNSTAISGSVDNVFILRREGDVRTFASVQRIGADMPPIVLALNAETGQVSPAGSKRAYDDAEMGRRILEVLQAGPLTEPAIQEHLDGRKSDKVRVLRILLATDQVERSGSGRKGDAFRYQNAGSHGMANSAGGAKGREPAFREKSTTNPGLFDAPENAGSQVPVYRWEPEFSSTDSVLRTKNVRSTGSDSPILVPAGSENGDHAPTKPPLHPDKHCSEAGSHDSRADEPDEEEL